MIRPRGCMPDLPARSSSDGSYVRRSLRHSIPYRPRHFMQSSAVVALRVAVMLTCLIVAPMAAIFGSSLPKVISSLVQGKGFPRTAREATAADLRAQGGEAPVFGASVQVPGRENSPAGTHGHEEAAPIWPTSATDPAIAPTPPSQSQP